jgi:hypothetical protein
VKSLASPHTHQPYDYRAPALLSLSFALGISTEHQSWVELYLHMHSQNMGSTITLYRKYTHHMYNVPIREADKKWKRKEKKKKKDNQNSHK